MVLFLSVCGGHRPHRINKNIIILKFFFFLNSKKVSFLFLSFVLLSYFTFILSYFAPFFPNCPLLSIFPSYLFNSPFFPPFFSPLSPFFLSSFMLSFLFTPFSPSLSSFFPPPSSLKSPLFILTSVSQLLWPLTWIFRGGGSSYVSWLTGSDSQSECRQRLINIQQQLSTERDSAVRRVIQRFKHTQLYPSVGSSIVLLFRSWS